MLGAIIGDIIGSSHEFKPIKTTEFELFDNHSRFTDDTILTVAVMKAIMESRELNTDLSSTTTNMMQFLARSYHKCGFGTLFTLWLRDGETKPYNSYGNGAAMRISPVAYAGDKLEEVLDMAEVITNTTHNHPYSIMAAKATVSAIFMAKHKATKEDIKKYIRENYYPEEIDLDKIRPTYEFDATCQGSVPESFQCFFDANSFEETVRLAVSLGGDSDTQACIAGAIAGEYYGIPQDIQDKAKEYLDNYIIEAVDKFEQEYIR